MEEFSSLLLLFVGRPAEGLRRIREHPSILTAYISLLLTGLLDALSFRLLDLSGLLKSLGLAAQVIQSAQQAQHAPATFWGFITEPLIVTLLSVVIIDAVAQLAWKRSAALPLFISLSFVSLIGGILRFAGLLLSGVLSGVVSDILSCVAILYVVVMGVLAVRFLYEKNAFKAALAYLVPLLLGLLALVLMTLAMGGLAS